MNSLHGIGMTSQRTRARMIERLREEGIRDERVLAAMAAVPRHIFVEEALAHRAYEDTALPLILGQTISQPYVVARMIELLIAGRELGKTLEIGAGCGYQAAVLAQLSKNVFAVERLAPLLAMARENLRQTRQTWVRLKHADGMGGLAEAAPLDSIAVEALGLELHEFRYVSVLVKQRNGTMRFESRRKDVVIDSKPFAITAGENTLTLPTANPGDSSSGAAKVLKQNPTAGGPEVSSSVMFTVAWRAEPRL